MRIVLALALALLSCGSSPAQLRLQRVQEARAGAASVAGSRQAYAFAEAVHAAYLAGDYRSNPRALATDTADAIAAIDRATPSAGVDTATLIAWRGLMLLDTGRPNDALLELERAFALGPNEIAGRALIPTYGRANRPDRVGQVCAATVPVLRSDDDKLSLIAMCRQNMNAASNEAEMAWMSPELLAWYQTENARRLGAQIQATNAQREREREEQRIVRQTEQCTASCKESGLRCQNECYGDPSCERRCVGINQACVDRCTSRAYEQLDQ
jgi:hypothetical protein